MNNNEKLPSSSVKIKDKKNDPLIFDILNDESCFDHPDYQIFIKYVDYPFNLLAKSTIAFIEKHWINHFI